MTVTGLPTKEIGVANWFCWITLGLMAIAGLASFAWAVIS